VPLPNTITSDKLSRLIGTPRCPPLIDVRDNDDFDANPHLVPSSLRRPARGTESWSAEFRGLPAIIICRDGLTASHGIAARLRSDGIAAEVLDGGIEAWRSAGLPVVSLANLPITRDAVGRTVWVTRARPKIDRIACPWLIRRFIDPQAVFLFVPPSEVTSVAERFDATPFDIENVYWSHRGDNCTFDTMVEEFGLGTEPLLQLATLVRAADTARLDLAPEAAGLLAASLGLSRMYADDLEQLDAGFVLYDAFYRWCRDATDETHNWPTNKGRA